MKSTKQTALQLRLEAARKQLAWMPISTLFQCIKDAKEGRVHGEKFVVELCATWLLLEPERNVDDMITNARAVMLLAQHGG